MRVVTLNVNGLRSAGRKGLMPWLEQSAADLLCLQETKAQRADLPEPLAAPEGWHTFFHDAERRGYSGVAIYARRRPDRVRYGLGWPDFDAEGRYLQVDYGSLSVVSLYLPSGSSGPERQEVKFDVLGRFLPLLQKMRRSRRRYILCGDFNIAHKPIDLRNWRSNQKNSGFLPEERAWLDRVLDEVGWVDAFRVVDPGSEQYTWWSNRGQSWAKNVGWRIDYQIVSPALRGKVLRADIYKAQRFSDHAPLIIDYDL